MTLVDTQSWSMFDVELNRFLALPEAERKGAVLVRMKPSGTEYVPFTVTLIDAGEYFGFTLDGDGRFLLGDFTVTHNSTEVARTFPKALYVQTSPTCLKAAADLHSRNPALMPQIPTRVTLDERSIAEWKDAEGSTLRALSVIVGRYVRACEAGTCEFEGIVFDEWNVLCERIYAELKADTSGKFKGRNGQLNIFAVMDAFKQFHRMILGLTRRTRKATIFVCHYQTPRIDEDDNSPMKGQIKWPGGPKMPMGLSDQIVEICADADAVLQMVVEEPKIVLTLDGTQPPQESTRRLLTQLEPKWFRKIRGFGVSASEPVDVEKGMGLREVLTKAGFRV